MHFTIHRDKRIDSVIQSQLDLICKAIATKLPVESIILTGGFGRGEGSVIIEGDKVIPLNDYDLVVVVENFRFVDRILKFKALRQLSEKLAEKVGIDFVDIYVLSVADIKSLAPTIFNYELRYGSTVIYGNNVLKDLPATSPKEIPLWEGTRLLYNRMLGLLWGFSTEYLSKMPTKKKREFLISQCVKAALACCESLLLLAGEYNYSCQKRREIFNKNYKRMFNELYEVLPKLSERVSIATDFKLSPDYDMFDDPVELWFNLKKEIGIVFKYYLGKSMGISEDGWAEIADRYLSKNERMSIANLTENMTYILKMWTLAKKRSVTLRVLNARISPIHRVYAIALLMLSCINENGKIDKEIFTIAQNEIRKIYPYSLLKGSSLLTEWNHVRRDLIQAWLMC